MQVLPSPMKPALQAHVWLWTVLVQVALALQPPLLVAQWSTAEMAKHVGGVEFIAG